WQHHNRCNELHLGLDLRHQLGGVGQASGKDDLIHFTAEYRTDPANFLGDLVAHGFEVELCLAVPLLHAGDDGPAVVGPQVGHKTGTPHKLLHQFILGPAVVKKVMDQG